MDNFDRYLKCSIRSIPDFPKPGILYRDITPILSDPVGLNGIIDSLCLWISNQEHQVTKIAGIESRGFIIGGAIASSLDIGFIPIRKKGKLPWATISQEYNLEYGTDALEMHMDAVEFKENVVVIDDLLATGGTALAAINLLRRRMANVVGCGFIVDLPDLGGSKKIIETGIPIKTLCSYEGK